MPTSTPRTLVPSSPTRAGSQAHNPKSCSSLNPNWLANSLLAAKAVTAAAECVPFPQVKAVFGAFVVLLETIEKLKRNRDDLKELCENAMDIINIIHEEIISHGETAAFRLKDRCEELESLLQDIVNAVKQLQKEPRSFSGRFKELLKLASVAEGIASYRAKMQELRSNFILMAGIDTNFIVHDTHLAVKQIYETLSSGTPPNIAQTAEECFPQSVNKYPPPSSLFQGGQIILEQMHQYFTEGSGKQNAFLLHGPAGSGKTEIALKFMEFESSHFSRMFFIDTRTPKTIDIGLKSVASITSAGSTSEDALNWLRTNQEAWLLCFDGADDPKIDLKPFFPECSHGNILITSRNSELGIHAGSHWFLSVMEEPDAVELLLRSAAEDITPENQRIAAQIVQELCHLPSAIVRAGAVVSKFGLNGYLAVLQENLGGIPCKMPAHGAWTKQITFRQFSNFGAPCFQFCSFACVVAILGMLFKLMPTPDETFLSLRPLADVQPLLPAAADSKVDLMTNQALSGSVCHTATENIGITHLDLCQEEEVAIETIFNWGDLWQLEEPEFKQAMSKKELV
ncbi:P-loop containing nucleoside triphosphate hydrolase protein [Mycena galopus ATCC 62051]|nr:P-loop containing nucleoside triphosphate hydrolase protein [Mycena galopus ATCC 62051]